MFPPPVHKPGNRTPITITAAELCTKNHAQFSLSSKITIFFKSLLSFYITALIFHSVSPAVTKAQKHATLQYGYAIDAVEQVQKPGTLAMNFADRNNTQWRAKGNLHRKYRFPTADADMPYRLLSPLGYIRMGPCVTPLRLPAVFGNPDMGEQYYPLDNIRNTPVFMTEGKRSAPSLVGSKAILAWVKERGFK